MQWLAKLLFQLLFISSVICENKTPREFKNKKVLAVFGYLNDYKLDQKEYPDFLLAPIILVPKLIEIQPVNQATSDSKEKPEDNSKTKEIMQKPLKIIKFDTKVTENNDDIDVHFRQALNRGSVSKNDSLGMKINETLKPSENSTEDKTSNGTTTTPKTVTTEENTVNNNTNITTTTESSGIYPAAVNNQNFNNLAITTETPGYFLLPPLLENDINNFTNINVSIANDNKTSTNSEEVPQYPKVNETDSTIKGPYPAALYNNTEIDQLSITTNLSTNGSPLPPPQDDRWKSFSSLDKMLPVLNEFRPLAGLYYDGFLHKPLYKKPGFVPYNHYYYWQQ